MPRDTHCCTPWLRPHPSSPHLDSYTRALLVSQDKRHHLVAPCLKYIKYCTYPRVLPQKCWQWIGRTRGSCTSPLHKKNYFILKLIKSTCQRENQSCRYLPCKKRFAFSRPQPECHLPNSPWRGIIKLFPARESLFSGILPGNGKIDNLFYSEFHLYDKRSWN